MSEPKTCLCGAMTWQQDDKEWWPTNAEIDLYLVAEADSLFCPRCGARLLPNGEVEPRGEVVGEAWAWINDDNNFANAGKVTAIQDCEPTGFLTYSGASPHRVLLVRADPPDEPKGDGDE